MVALYLKALLIFGAIFGPTLAKEYCPAITVIEQLDLDKLAGMWWVWDFSGMIAYTEPHKCHVSQFYAMPGGKSLSVVNDYVYMTDKPNHVRYSWTIDDEDSATNGKLVASMKLNRMGLKRVPFLVLDTDYDRYLLVHMCKHGPHFLSSMRSTLTMLRNTTYTEEELTEIGSKVEAALKKSSLTREDLGLAHADSYTKDCEVPKFPVSVQSGHSTIIDTQALTATVNGLATHAAHAVDDANALAADAADPATDRAVLAGRLKDHAEDVKALSSDVKQLSSL